MVSIIVNLAAAAVIGFLIWYYMKNPASQRELRRRAGQSVKRDQQDHEVKI